MSKATDFREIALLTDPESGLVAPICFRDRNGEPDLSFAIMKEFDRAGRVERTAYIKKRHIAGARRLLDKMEEQLDAEEDRLRGQRREAARKASSGS